jgi:hypothetical protein
MMLKVVGVTLVLLVALAVIVLGLLPGPQPTVTAAVAVGQTLQVPVSTLTGEIVQFNPPRDGSYGLLGLRDGRVLLFDDCEKLLGQAFPMGTAVEVEFLDGRLLSITVVPAAREEAK